MPASVLNSSPLDAQARAARRATSQLGKRGLLSQDEASNLQTLFKLLANDTRLRLLHALAKAGELCVGDLSSAMEMKPQAVSNQLQRLSTAGVLDSRREGNSIFYRIVDPCVPILLDRGLCLVAESTRRRTRSASGNGR